MAKKQKKKESSRKDNIPEHLRFLKDLVIIVTCRNKHNVKQIIKTNVFKNVQI